MFTDNKDFYPTPESLFLTLMNGARNIGGKILEPSAGNGALIGHIRKLARRASVQIDAIESDSRLTGVLMGEGINVVWSDFLTYETYKEYDAIIMNPPFSNGVDHVLKALELAENQLSRCDLFIIVNKETISNPYSTKRKELVRKLDAHNAKIRYVSDSFVDAERTTDVEVALINVSVEKSGRGKSIYDKIPFINASKTEESLGTALSTYVKTNEVGEKLRTIERLILEYETACELSRNTFKAAQEKSQFMDYINNVNKRSGSWSRGIGLIETQEFSVSDLNEELARLRRGYWALILDTDEIKGKLTNEAIQQLNKRLSSSDEMEINLVNVEMLIMALMYNRGDILTESVVSIFKKITEFHQRDYSANIHYYNGWKTNNAYKINKKIIIPIQYSPFEPTWDFDEDYGKIQRDVRDYITDIVKAFQLIDSDVRNEFTSISKQEFENDLLRFRMFLNGNIHVWFKDLTLLSKLNYLCGKHFNWLPTDDEVKTDDKAREFVNKEFGDVVGTVLIGG